MPALDNGNGFQKYLSSRIVMSWAPRIPGNHQAAPQRGCARSRIRSGGPLAEVTRVATYATTPRQRRLPLGLRPVSRFDAGRGRACADRRGLRRPLCSRASCGSSVPNRRARWARRGSSSRASGSIWCGPMWWSLRWRGSASRGLSLRWAGRTGAPGGARALRVGGDRGGDGGRGAAEGVQPAVSGRTRPAAARSAPPRELPWRRAPSPWRRRLGSLLRPAGAGGRGART